MRNRVSVLTADLDIAIEEREVPVPGAHEVLVSVRSVGVCGSDVHYFETGRIGPFVVEGPLILGHEASGVVAALGSDVRDLAVGTRVALEPGVPCGACDQCRSGRYNLCPDVVFFATPPVDGAFAEYVVIHEDFAHPVPDAISDDAAALLEPLSVGLWACRKAGVSLGASVLIAGAGPVGVMTAMVARASGAGRIVISDVNVERLAKAAELGFEPLDPRETNPTDAIAADAFIDCSGNPSAIDAGVRAVKPAGRVVMVGMAADGMVPLPVDVIQGRELWVTGTFRYANTYPAAIELAASGAVNLDQLVSKVFSLEDVRSALSFHHEDPTAMKVVVRVGPQGEPG